MIQTNWHVIVGGPSSGKTTLINYLDSQGYHTVPEMARIHIKERLSAGSNLEDIIEDNAHFQREVLSRVLKRERQLPKNQLIFFDRGAPDSVGYFRYHHLETETILKACQKIRYQKIFYCHQLPMNQDAFRMEDSLAAKKLGDLIYQAYFDLGYPLIELPAISVQERMDIVLSHLE